MSLPVTLERLAGQLREATGAQARRHARRRRLQVLAVSFAAMAALGSVAVAGGWLGGKPAPDSVKRALRVELAASSAQARSVVGAPIASEAIIAASLDARHFVWGAPTTTGGYCVGVSGPHAVIDGASCSTTSGGMWESYYDCDGSVIIGGRITALARPNARTLVLRHDGTTLRIALDPAHHGFFIARLPAAFFGDVTSHDRPFWPRTAIVDALGRVVPPVNVNSGRMAPPDHPLCAAATAAP